MSKKANYFKIGIFVLAGAAMLAGGLIVFGIGEIFEKGVPIETYLDQSVQGLEVGSPIKYRGVKVGSVKEITIVNQYYPQADSDFARYVLVRGELYSRLFERGSQDLNEIIRTELDRGLRIRMASQGITGLSYLEVDYFEPDRYQPLEINWDPKVPYLPSAPSFIAEIGDSLEKVAQGLEESNIQEIAKKLDELLATIITTVEDSNVKELSEETVALLNETRQTNERIRQFVEKPEIDSIPKDIAEATERVNLLLDQSEEDVVDLIRELKTSSREIQNLTAKVSAIVEDEKIQSTLTEIQAAARNARETTDNAREASEKARDVGQKLPDTILRLDATLKRLEIVLGEQQEDIDTIINNVRDITDNVRDTTETTRKYPSLLLFGSPPNRESME